MLRRAGGMLTVCCSWGWCYSTVQPQEAPRGPQDFTCTFYSYLLRSSLDFCIDRRSATTAECSTAWLLSAMSVKLWSFHVMSWIKCSTAWQQQQHQQQQLRGLDPAGVVLHPGPDVGCLPWHFRLSERRLRAHLCLWWRSQLHGQVHPIEQNQKTKNQKLVVRGVVLKSI